MTRLAFYPIGNSYLLVAVVALILVGLLAWGPGRTRTKRPQRMALLALRAAVIALVLLAMLRPTIVYTKITKEPLTLVMLLDQTRSMSVRDEAGGKQTRWEALGKTLSDRKVRAALRNFKVKAYTFDAEPHPIDIDNGKISLRAKPEGQQTAIGSTLSRVLQEEAGKRLSAVIMLSDGAQRAMAPYDMLPQAAAARLEQMGVPLHTVAFGESLGLGQTRDVAVESLRANQTVYVKNQLAIAGEVRIGGFVNREIPVELLFETPSGKLEVVDRKTLKATVPGESLPIAFQYAPQFAGEYRLMLRAVVQPGEKVTTNNQWSTFVNVLKGGINVLYLEGVPARPEQAFLIRALKSSPNIHVDYPVPPLDPRDPASRPGDFSERFRPGRYDVYILGNLDARVFQSAESIAAGRDPRAADFPLLSELAQTVNQGAGLIMLGGIHSFGPGGYATTPLDRVLPVRMDRFARQQFDKPVRPDQHLAESLSMKLTQFGMLHFALKLADDQQQNAALWAQLPELREANRFRVLDVAQMATVLLDAGRNTPLLVSHQYGGGRVMAFAGDSTWRWVMHGHETAHKRFWRQIVLWLARKDQAIDRHVSIRLQKRRFAPSSEVEFSVAAESATGEPIPDADFEARLVLPDKSRIPIRIAGNHVGRIPRSDTQASGDYAIEVDAKHNGAALGTARSRFMVFKQDLEMDDPAADKDMLQSLAKRTGGELLAPEQLAKQLEKVAKDVVTIEQEVTETFWDKWSFFLLLVGILGFEWYLRKRWGLV